MSDSRFMILFRVSCAYFCKDCIRATTTSINDYGDNMNKLKLTALTASLAFVLGSASSAYAGAFQLFEQDAAGLGTAQATAGASALSAATEYSNPAGMVRFKRAQFTSGMEMVDFYSNFTGSTQTVLGGDTTSNLQTGGAPGGTKNNMVPNIHFVKPLNDKLYYGAGLTVPYGLSTDYKDDSIVAQYATESTIETKNLSQDLAYAVNSHFSLGAGLDFQQFNGEFSANEGSYALDTNEVSSNALGWHAGLLYQINSGIRFGLAYHSEITQKATGTGNYLGSPYSDVKTNFILPAWLTFGAHFDVTNRWSVMSTVNYTFWNKVQNLTLEGISLLGEKHTVVTPTHFKNTMAVSVGTEYKFNKKWTGKFGLGYDPTPTQDQYRELRLPDANKTTVAVGVHYQASKQIGFDLGYEHAFVKDAKIDTTILLPNLTGLNGNAYVLKGTSKGSADIVGFQATCDF